MCSKVPMRFSGRRLNLKLYTGHTLYVHAHAIRSISLNAFMHFYRSVAAHPFHPCFNKERKIRAQRPLILYVQYIHFRFPGLHRFLRARDDVDVNRLLARFKTEIISIRNSVRNISME